MPLLHEGRSLEDAIVLKANNESVGIRMEREYLSYHDCTFFYGAKYSQALITKDDKVYDRLTTTGCSADANHDYYFDITSFLAASRN